MSVGQLRRTGPMAPSFPPNAGTPASGPAEDRPRSLHVRTVDDIASFIGAVAASLAVVWIVYERLLAFSGSLGFILCWYAVFLAFYGCLTALSNPRTLVMDRLVSAIVQGGAAVVGLVLVTTVGQVFVKGWPALHHLNFFTADMSQARPTSPLTKGGILHALIGTLIQVSIAVVIAVPLAVGTAVYLSEVGGRLAMPVRTVVEAMTALPDILAGLFIYVLLVVGLGWERDGFAVSLALAVTMVPVMARSAEVVLKLVSGNLREAGHALGASQWQTVRRVVLPTARAGLATSLILGIARIAGETAPLLIVSGESTFFNKNPLHNPMSSLPLFVFKAVRSGAPINIQRGYGAAAVLITVVLILFVVTRILARSPKGSR